MNKTLLFCSYLFSNKVLASTATASAAGVSAVIAGFDPFPWVLATMGMVFMLINLEPDEKKTKDQIRKEALANGLVSLVCGGLGGPWTAIVFGIYVNPRLESPLLMAFLISAFWQIIAFRVAPVALPPLINWAKNWADNLVKNLGVTRKDDERK